VWDPITGEKALGEHQAKREASHLTFSQDGERLGCLYLQREKVPWAEEWECEGAEVRVWDTARGRGLLALRATAPNAVRPGLWPGIALSPDGTRLATAHGDDRVKVWSVKQLLEQARSSR
jgi:hypothetical protein